jgi:chromate reductase
MTQDRLDVVALVGSLRRESFTRRLVEALARLAPPSVQIEIVDIGGLSFFNQDEEATPPAAWQTFRARIKRADAVLFATPEYNRSLPAVIKNAIDVGSRPYGQSVWSGKPAAVLSVSPGAIGAFGANHHLRQSLVFLDMPTLQQPEMYVSGADKIFDAAGELADPRMRQRCERFVTAFAAWAVNHASKAA